MSEASKDEVLAILTRDMDDTICRLGWLTSIAGFLGTPVRVDYVQQSATIDYGDGSTKPSREDLERLGYRLRASWPEMPHLIATIYVLRSGSTKLLLDFSKDGRTTKIIDETPIPGLSSQRIAP